MLRSVCLQLAALSALCGCETSKTAAGEFSRPDRQTVSLLCGTALGLSGAPAAVVLGVTVPAATEKLILAPVEALSQKPKVEEVKSEISR